MADLDGLYYLDLSGGGLAEEYLGGELLVSPTAGSRQLAGFQFAGSMTLVRRDDESSEERHITGRYSTLGDRVYFTDADMATVAEVGAFYFHGVAFVPSNVGGYVAAVLGDVGRVEVTQVGGRFAIHLGWESSRFLVSPTSGPPLLDEQ
jgi:hypothetical protein